MIAAINGASTKNSKASWLKVIGRSHRLPPVYDFPGLLAIWFVTYPVKTVKPVFPGSPLHDCQWSGTFIEASATVS